MWLVEILVRPTKESRGFFEVTNEQIASWYYHKDTFFYNQLMHRLSLGESYEFAVWYIFDTHPEFRDNNLYGQAVYLT